MTMEHATAASEKEIVPKGLLAGAASAGATSSTAESKDLVPSHGLDWTRRLAADVSAAILSKAAIIEQSEGEIKIRVFRTGRGHEVKINVTV